VRPSQSARKALLVRRAALLLAVLSLALLFPAFALASAAPAGSTAAVRVGYFYNGDFMHKSDSGDYNGYDIEYYYTIAGYAGWDIRFVEYDSLAAALDGLKQGDIDVMSGLSKTPERESNYLISAQKMCAAHIAVQTRADDDRFAAGDTASMADLRCGILKGSNVVTLYTQWCRNNGLVPHIVEYDSLDQRNAALADRQVDAIAGGSTIEGAQKIAEFPSLDLYFMFNRGRADLKSQLDRSMSILSLQDPSFAGNLFSQYFPTSRNTAHSFSADEKAYIAAHPTLRVAVLQDDAPFSSAAADGTVSGILADYFAHLSQVTGITFQYLPVASNSDALAALSAGRADLIGKCEDDVYRAARQQVILTVPYLKMNLVCITRAGTDSIARTAVPQCIAPLVSDLLQKRGSAVAVTASTNNLQAFQSLKSGRVDSVISTQPAATWLLNRNRASDYVVSSFSGKTWDGACALPYGEAGNTLRSILNKSIAVDNGFISQLITSEVLTDSADLGGLFDHLPVGVIASVAILAVLLLAISVAALVVIVRRRRAERLLDAQRGDLLAEQQANAARRTFFGAVSHDMRTPLNGISGFADLALRSSDPAAIRDYLGKIRTSSGILSGLVNDMLIMSRIENGKYTLHPAPTNSSEILSGVLDSVRVAAAGKDIHFVNRSTESCGHWVLADRLSMQKVMLNLLSNAIKFTPTGGTVTLDCSLTPAGGGLSDSVITVSDTGPGISKEFLPHVFEPFAQENAVNADSAGSGMGLSIVKSIVDAMGGTIEVQSNPGKGTVFTVRLQLQETEPPQQGAAPGEPPRFCGRRALVCEDNPLNLEIIRSILEHSGFAVTAAENGRLGLQAFEASQPGSIDLVLLDLRMPVMGGMEAARALRALPRSDAASVPIIAVSADAFPENIQECLDAGMDAHVAKPVDVTELMNTIAKLLDR